MGRKSTPIHIIVHEPQTEDGKCALARRAAEVHADAVERMLQKLNRSAEQKKQILDDMIKDASVRG